MSKIIFNLIVLTFLVSCSSTSKRTNDEKRAEIYYNHGTNALVEKRYTDALRYLLESDSIYSKSDKTKNNLAMAYFFKNKPELAKKYFLESLKLNPKNSDARNNLASILLNQKNYKKALSHYITVSKDLLYRHQYRTFYNIALIYKAQGKISSAIKYLKKSVEEKRDYCPASFHLAAIFESAGDYPRALKAYSDSSTGTCFKKSPITLFKKAKLLQKMGKVNESISAYNKILENFPKSKYSPMSSVELKKLESETKEMSDLERAKLKLLKLREKRNGKEIPAYQ